MVSIETQIDPNYLNRVIWRIYGRVNNEYLCAECPVEESDKIKLRIIKNIVERLEKMV